MFSARSMRELGTASDDCVSFNSGVSLATRGAPAFRAKQGTYAARVGRLWPDRCGTRRCSVRPAAEWRSVTDRPKVSERIPEAALAVRSPSLLVVFEFRAGAGARDDRALHKAVWIVDEQLDPRARDAEPVWTVLRLVLRAPSATACTNASSASSRWRVSRLTCGCDR